jgi:hypothetical protein
VCLNQCNTSLNQTSGIFSTHRGKLHRGGARVLKSESSPVVQRSNMQDMKGAARVSTGCPQIPVQHEPNMVIVLQLCRRVAETSRGDLC